jgi:Mce-associated membrane protein
MTEVDTTVEEKRRSPASERRTVPAGAFVIAVLVAGALAILAVFALASGDGGSGGGGEDQEVRLAAGRFAERFLTFEHDELDAWKDDVLALSTGGFAEEVEEVESGLRTLIAESELDAVTQVTDIFVGEVDRGGVEVVVVYDRELRGGEQGRTESDRYLQLAMIRIDGEWLVDNVLDIASAGDLGGSVAPVEGGSGTSTPPTSEGG